jgi:hypothetical protein
VLTWHLPPVHLPHELSELIERLRSVTKGMAAGIAELVPPSVMIEKFAGVRGWFGSNFSI